MVCGFNLLRMTFTGLFLFKDLVSLGANFYLLSYFRQKAQRLKS